MLQHLILFAKSPLKYYKCPISIRRLSPKET